MAQFSKTLKRYQNYLNARQAATGVPASTADREAILSAALEAEAATSASNKSLEMQQEALKLQQEQARATSKAATMSGIVQTASSGAQLYMMYKDMKTKSPGATDESIWDTISKKMGWDRGAKPAGAPPSAAVPAMAEPSVAYPYTATAESTAIGVPGFVPSAAAEAPALYSESLDLTAGTVGTAEIPGFVGSEAALAAEAAAPAAAPAATTLGTVAPLVGLGAGLYTMATSEQKQTGGMMAGASIALLAGAGPLGLVLGAVGGNAFGKAMEGSVICTELWRQGYLPYNVLVLDGMHRRAHIDADTYLGYMRWAPKVVWILRHVPGAAWLIAPIGRAWAYEMASRMDSSVKGSYLGKVLLRVGVPICRWLGR